VTVGAEAVAVIRFAFVGAVPVARTYISIAVPCLASSAIICALVFSVIASVTWDGAPWAEDDVKEVTNGMECGIGVHGFSDLKEGDLLEAFTTEKMAADLGAVVSAKG